MTGHRRVMLFVSLAAAIMLAGCAEPAGRLALDPVNDTGIADHASRSIAGDHDRPAERIVPAAVKNGSATATGQRPVITSGLPFAYDGAYYNLSSTIINTTDGLSISVSTDYTTADPGASRIVYSNLPSVDRRIVDDLFPQRPRLPEGEESGKELRIGAGAVYTPAQQETSVFFPEQQYDAIVYNGTAYTVRREEPREATVHTYRYTAEQVAASPQQYASQLRDRYLFTLSGLTAEEQSVVDAAKDDRYYAEDEDDAAFAAVLDRFRPQPAVRRSDDEGEWLVEYDGTTYWADLSFHGFQNE